MSNAWLTEFDALAFPAFASIGLGDSATYTAPGGSPVAGTVFVDREARYLENDASYSYGMTVTVQIAEFGVPVRGGVIEVGGESFSVDRVIERDESRAVCLVRPAS